MSIESRLEPVVKRFRFPSANSAMQRIKALEAERDRLTEERDQRAESLLAALEERKDAQLWIATGHYYSPIPSKKELKAREATIWGPYPKSLPSINLNEEAQIALLKAFVPYYREIPFAAQKKHLGCAIF